MAGKWYSKSEFRARAKWGATCGSIFIRTAYIASVGDAISLTSFVATVMVNKHLASSRGLMATAADVIRKCSVRDERYAERSIIIRPCGVAGANGTLGSRRRRRPFRAPRPIAVGIRGSGAARAAVAASLGYHLIAQGGSIASGTHRD